MLIYLIRKIASQKFSSLFQIVPFIQYFFHSNKLVFTCKVGAYGEHHDYDITSVIRNDSMNSVESVNKLHITLHPVHQITSFDYYALSYGESRHLSRHFEDFLQSIISKRSRYIPVEGTNAPGSVWSILFQTLCSSNCYNVFLYSYDDYNHGKPIYDVINYHNNLYLYNHHFYDVFTYSYDDHQTYHHPQPLDQ